MKSEETEPLYVPLFRAIESSLSYIYQLKTNGKLCHKK